MALERNIINEEKVAEKKSDSYVSSSMQYIKKALFAFIPERKPAAEIKSQAKIGEENRIIFSLFLPFLNRPLFLEGSEWNNFLDNLGGYASFRNVLSHLTEHFIHIAENDYEQYVNIAYFLHQNIVNIENSEILQVKQFLNLIISSLTFHSSTLSAQNHLKMAELIFCWGSKLADKIPFGIFHAQFALKMAESAIISENANFYVDLALKETNENPPKLEKKSTHQR